MTASDQNTIVTILQLQIQVRQQFREFNQQFIAVEQSYKNLDRAKYQQQWIRWQREMEIVRQHIQQLDESLNSNTHTATVQQWQEAQTQYKNTQNQENKLERELKQLRKDESRCQKQITGTLGQVLEILRRAKIEQDLKEYIPNQP